MQTLVGLHDYAEFTAQRRRRPALPRRRPPGAARRARADTGAWSLYQLGGAESDLGYHTLLRDFLSNLCDRTATDVYCETAAAFARDLQRAAGAELLTTACAPADACSCASRSRRSRASA